MAKISWVRISLVFLAFWMGIMAQGRASSGSGLTQSQPAFCPGEELHPPVSSGVMAGLLIKRPSPVYPREAVEAHVSGSVVLRVCIGTDGHVKNVQPVSGPEMLRKAWIDAVSRWEYRPYLVNGVPVPVSETVSMSIAMGAPPAEDSFCGSVRGDPAYPVRVSSGTMAGQLISRPDPILPPEAVREHVNGAVVMLACIGADGHVNKVAPIAGPEMLRKSYMDAVSRWVYRPYLLNGVAVPVITTVTISLGFGGG